MNKNKVLIVHIDELMSVCGYANSETTVNNHYGCTHPDQEEQEEDYRTGKQHGKCYCFSCPLGHEVDLQDMKELDKELYDEWKNEESDPSEMGANYLVVDESIFK